MEPTIFIVLAVAGFTELLRRIHLKDYFAALTIFGAGLIGLLAGLFNAPGVPDAWTGLIEGLSASGLITAAAKVGVVGRISAKGVKTTE